MMQKTCDMIETLAHGYSSESSQPELYNVYKHDMSLNGFQRLSMKVASALEGLSDSQAFAFMRN